jgi:hypothetical protein
LDYLPPLTTDRAPGRYIINVSGCDDSFTIFANNRSFVLSAQWMQVEKEKTGQVNGCQPSIHTYDISELDLSSEYTTDHGILCKAYRAYGLLTEEEKDEFW